MANTNETIAVVEKEWLEFDYVNWKGIASHRFIQVIGVHYGSTEYHPQPQFLVKGYDLIKSEIRDFAMKDMQDVKRIEEPRKG